MRLRVNRTPYTALCLLCVGAVARSQSQDARQSPRPRKPLGPRMARKGKSGEIPNTGKGYR